MVGGLQSRGQGFGTAIVVVLFAVHTTSPAEFTCQFLVPQLIHD